MPIVSGITNRGTVWIKKLDNQGNLLQKRVCRNRIQYDTIFSKHDGRPKLFLKTNFSKKTQTVYKFPPRGFLSKLMPQKSKGLKSIDSLNFLTAKHLRNITGFNNKKFDSISEKLFCQYLQQMEDMFL